jgi:hypothetical protein
MCAESRGHARRALRPLAPASQRTRSSARPRSSESSITSESPWGPRTASPESSLMRKPDPTSTRAASVSSGRLQTVRMAAAGSHGRPSPPCAAGAAEAAATSARRRRIRRAPPRRGTCESRGATRAGSGLQRLSVRTAALGHERPKCTQVIHADVLDSLARWLLVPQPADQLADSAVVELERPGRDQVALTLQPEDLVRILERRRATACGPFENPHGGCLHGRHSAVDLVARPRESPLTRHFLQSFHAAPPRTPREFSSYSECRGQIDVVGATGLEPATPCSQINVGASELSRRYRPFSKNLFTSSDVFRD